MLNAYLSIEQLRFENKFRYHIHVSDNIETNRRIPFMIVQPLVENAIWHGLLPLEEQNTGKVNISFKALGMDRTLCIVIEDNGVGFAEDRRPAAKGGRSSSGIHITRRRLSLIHEHATLSVHPGAGNGPGPGRGTKVVITLP